MSYPETTTMATASAFNLPTMAGLDFGNDDLADDMEGLTLSFPKVKIPAGIDDGQTLNLRGKGNAGLDGGPAGDLLITVFVKPHPLFERDGNSVLMEMPVTFAQAALGAEIEVPTIDGRVKLTIPEGTQPGSVFRLRGKGIPYLQSKGGGRGDQFVTVVVETPTKLTREQKELLKQLESSVGDDGQPKRKSFFDKLKG